MKAILLLMIVAIAVMNNAGQTPTPTPAPAAKMPVVYTEADRAAALKYLDETKSEFVKEVSGLSEAQLNFRAAPNRWTIAEVAEHIVLSEGSILGLVRDRVLKIPAPAGKDDYRAKDLGVRLAITNRTQKFTAPEFLKPNSRFKTREELLTNFDKARNEVIDFVKTTKEDLRGHFFENPMMGTIDAHQWILFLAGHSERHLAQLKEVKTEASYPRK